MPPPLRPTLSFGSFNEHSFHSFCSNWSNQMSQMLGRWSLFSLLTAAPPIIRNMCPHFHQNKNNDALSFGSFNEHSFYSFCISWSNQMSWMMIGGWSSRLYFSVSVNPDFECQPPDSSDWAPSSSWSSTFCSKFRLQHHNIKVLVGHVECHTWQAVGGGKDLWRR